MESLEIRYNGDMNDSNELILDFDHTVTTEERYKIRHFMQDFLITVNSKTKEDLKLFFSPSLIAEGFTEFPQNYFQLVESFYQKFFGRKHNYIDLTNLKLVAKSGSYEITGEYQEYQEGVLVASGSIIFSLISKDESFQIIGIKFYPRMRLQEDYE